MKVIEETSLKDFEFWGGAVQTVKYLTDDELDAIEESLEELYPDGMGKTEINDYFWFEDDDIAQALGYADFESLMDERKEDAHEWDEDEEE